MPIVVQHNDNRQRDDTVTLVLAKLADPLMPRTQPNANLHPGLFLSPIDLDLNRYHGGMPAERGVERLVDRAKVDGLTPQPFRKRVVGDGLRDEVDDEVDESGFGVPVAGLG